jgi:hypothetical protein
MKGKQHVCLAALLGLVVLLVGGCQNMNTTQSSTAKGGVVGAASGAIIAGALHGGMSAGEGALVGAVVGGLIGHHQGKKATEKANAEATEKANTRVVYVSNANGSTTPVTLHLVDAGWRGPRGEVYPTLPSSEQLAGVYGLK